MVKANGLPVRKSLRLLEKKVKQDNEKKSVVVDEVKTPIKKKKATYNRKSIAASSQPKSILLGNNRVMAAP